MRQLPPVPLRQSRSPAAILVVDDRPANRDFVVTLLRERGHPVIEAADGAQALEIVRRGEADLALCDIVMPAMDGYEFARQLRADPSIAQVPVIFYTAYYHERESWNLARAAGASGVLMRPGEPAEIFAAIDKALSDATPAAAASGESSFDRDHLRVVSDKLAEKVDELLSANRKLSALTEINVELASQRDLGVLLESLCRSARELLGARHAYVWVLPVGAGPARFTVHGMSPESAALLCAPKPRPGWIAEVMATRRPARRGPGADAAALGLAANFPAGSWAVAAPIVSREATYGCIWLTDKAGGGQFDEDDERMLAALAAQVGSIYESAYLFQELRESEQRFRQLAENVNEVFFLASLDGSELLYVSPAYEEIWGRSCESLYLNPRAWLEAVHPEDAARVAHAQGDESSGFDYEYRIVRPDGGIRSIRSRGFPIRDPGGTVYRVAGVAQDITRRVELEKALRASEAGLHRSQQLARLAHVVTRRDGSFETWSESLPGLLGTDPAKVPLATREWLGLVVPADRDAFRDACLRAARTGTCQSVEYQLQRVDGEVIHVRQTMDPLDGDAPAGYVGRWFCTFQDISARKRAEEARRESERRFRDMFERLQLISIICDRDAVVTYCNDYLLELTGWTREELVGRSWFETLAPPDSGALRELFGQLVLDAPAAWHHENDILTRNGKRRLVRWNNTVLRSDQGEVVGVASIGEDITERKRAESEVLRLNANLERRVVERTAQLQAANKELEAFDYSVSHDLRGPVNRIAGFAAALAEQCGARLGDEGAGFLERITGAAQGMNQLIDDLLALSMVGREGFNRVPVDLARKAATVFENLRKAEPGRNVEIVVMPALLAFADPGLSRIVMENLIGNAWKFSAGRATAHIEVGMVAQAEPTIFWVRDDGAGFDPADAAKLFAPFRSLHAAGEFAGTGIGLATVQRIIHRHGGRIWAEGTPGLGATFYFTLAADSAGAADGRPGGEPERRAQLASPHPKS